MQPKDDKQYQPETIKHEDQHGSAAPADNHGVSEDELRRFRNELGEEMLQAEDVAALKEGRMPTSPEMQEKHPGGKIDLGSVQDMYRRSAQNRQRGGRRGILVGVGAGGGIASMVAGFAFMLPFKLPGVMNTLIDDAGKRLEHVAERRAERVFIKYILQGSRAAVTNGKVIATGNPLGDVFANIRTSNFEAELLRSDGLSFEPGPNKTVRLVHNGSTILDAEKDADIIKLLEKDTLDNGDLKKIVRRVIKSKIPIYGFLKRAKFVGWLRLKYDVRRFGVREREPDERQEDYLRSVDNERMELSIETSARNMEQITGCIVGNGDCVGDEHSSDSTDELRRQTTSAMQESARELAGASPSEITEGITRKVVTKVLTKVGLGAAAGSIPIVGQIYQMIDLSARTTHFLGQAIDNGVLQKMLAQANKASTAAIGIGYAGLAGQTQAGDLEGEAVGMFANRFDGWETSQAYNYINNGTAVGVGLDAMEKINETITLPTFATLAKSGFDTVGWISRAPLEAWFYTVSKAADFVGEKGDDIIKWALKFTPAQALMDTISPHLGALLEGMFKMFGVFIDFAAIGAKLALYVHEAFIGMFNDFSKESGMRLLTGAQGVVMDQEIRAEHMAYIQDQSVFERLFNPANPDSLAANIATTVPSYAQSNPLLAMATMSTRMVASAPSNLARVGTNTAYAAEPLTSEMLYNANMYGGLKNDLDADIDPNVASSEPKPCPENNDNAFNHCTVDRQIVDSMNCVFVKCKDMEVANAEGGAMFADYTGPLYGPDAIQNKQNTPQFAWSNLLHPVGLLAAFLPIAALEVSRRGGK